MAIAIEQIHVVRGFVYFTVQANFILFIIRIDRHKFIPCQELTLFRTEVKKKSSSGDFTYPYKRYRGVTPRTETPAQFRDFRGATRHADKSVDDVTI